MLVFSNDSAKINGKRIEMQMNRREKRSLILWIGSCRFAAVAGLDIFKYIILEMWPPKSVENELSGGLKSPWPISLLNLRIKCPHGIIVATVRSP